MHLSLLNIRRVNYGEREGQLDGEVTFANPKGEIKLMLSPGQLRGVLELCADALVESAKECAQVMAANIVDSSPALAAPEAIDD